MSVDIEDKDNQIWYISYVKAFKGLSIKVHFTFCNDFHQPELFRLYAFVFQITTLELEKEMKCSFQIKSNECL